MKQGSLSCDQEYQSSPSIQFYKKEDRSFPVAAKFTNIQVKSPCIDLPQEYVTFLTMRIHKRLLEKIQRVENEALSYLVAKYTLESKTDVKDLEDFVSDRKDNLRNLIPLLSEENHGNYTNYPDSQKIEIQRLNSYAAAVKLSDSVNLSIQIPLSRSSAQAELDFLSSMDINKSSIGLITRENKIEQYKNKHDFSDLKIVNLSSPSDIIVSKRNLYLSIFFIFLIISVGYVSIVLTEYKYHKKQP